MIGGEKDHKMKYTKKDLLEFRDYFRSQYKKQNHINIINNNTKETNPKQALGSNKIPMHVFPNTATIYGALAMLEGMLKYGRSNYRKAGVKISIYYDACRRHLDSYFEGEDTDPDSGLPHLAKALACIAILIDATVNEKITDDRMYCDNVEGYKKVKDEMTKHVIRLKEQYKNENPKHWTIKDREVK